MAAIPMPIVPAEDPLFEPLLKFVTTGSNARNVSHGKIKQAIEETKAVPGGQAYLEFIANAGVAGDHSEFSGWEDEDQIYGSIDLSKSLGTFDILCMKTQLHFTLYSYRFFLPFHQTITRGTLYYHAAEDMTPGPVNFTVHQYYDTVIIKVFRDNHQICTIEVNHFRGNIGPIYHEGKGQLS